MSTTAGSIRRNPGTRGSDACVYLPSSTCGRLVADVPKSTVVGAGTPGVLESQPTGSYRRGLRSYSHPVCTSFRSATPHCVPSEIRGLRVHGPKDI